MKKEPKTMFARAHFPHVSVPSRRTLREQAPAAIIASALLAFFVWLIPMRLPIELKDGVITPSVVRSGDEVRIKWTRRWDDLCPLSVTREFVGSDDFKSPSSVAFLIEPPHERGLDFPDRAIRIPKLPPGEAYYQSTIKPLCPFDLLIHQRTYRSPQVKVLVLPPVEAGPR